MLAAALDLHPAQAIPSQAHPEEIPTGFAAETHPALTTSASSLLQVYSRGFTNILEPPPLTSTLRATGFYRAGKPGTCTELGFQTHANSENASFEGVGQLQEPASSASLCSESLPHQDRSQTSCHLQGDVSRTT